MIDNIQNILVFKKNPPCFHMRDVIFYRYFLLPNKPFGNVVFVVKNHGDM